MIVVSIGDIIAWVIGGIALIVLGIAYIIDRTGSRKEKKFDIAIGKYDEEVNQRNRSVLIGQGNKEEKPIIISDMRGEE